MGKDNEPRQAPAGNGSQSHPLKKFLVKLGLLHSRTIIPIQVFIVSMLAISIHRLLILLTTPAYFSEASAGTIAMSFIVGLRFDACIACSLIVPLMILLFPAPPQFLRWRWFRLLVSSLAAAIVTILIIVLTVDFFFFQEFGRHLNYYVIEYFEYDYVWKIIWDQFPVIPTVIGGVIVLVAAIFMLMKFGFNAPYRGAPAWRIIAWYVVMIALVVLGIRGSLGPKAINTGPAYFADSPEIAQLTLNGPFSLREAVYDHVARKQSLDELYDTIDRDEAFSTARKMLGRENDRFVEASENPLRRITDTGKPQKDYNVVVVIMESMGWNYFELLGGREDLMPNLTRITKHGILFDNCYSVGSRTTRGVVGILGGFPDLPGQSVITRSRSEGNFLTIGSVLRRRGYRTTFIHSGQPHYDHRQSFMSSNGFSDFVWPDDFTYQTFRTRLGWCDGDMFNTAHEYLTKHTAEGPVFAALLTLSLHRPYLIPDVGVESPYPDSPHAEHFRAVRYVDWAIGQFIEKARKSDYFDNTIFLFTADSCGGILSKSQRHTIYRIPLVIYAPAILKDEGRRISTVCSQTDIAPTIMNILGGRYRHSFFGSSALDRPEDKSWALIQDDRILMLIDGKRRMLMQPPHGHEPTLGRLYPPDQMRPVDDPNGKLKQKMRRFAISLLQSAHWLYTHDAYR